MSELESSEHLFGNNKVNVHDLADVSPKAELGAGVHVASGAVIGPDVIIGPNTIIEKCVISESVILADSKIYGAMIKKSIIGPDISLNQDIENTLIAPEGEKVF